MFARWLFVRLKAAETALRQGRLDDAYAVALQEDVREHSRAQRLLDDLVKPLLARARLHRQAGRFAEALAALDQLEAIGRGGADAQTLRQQIRIEMRQDDEQAADRRQAYQRAAGEIRAGRLESARHDLRHVDDPLQREELAEELEHRLERGSQLLQQAAEELEQEDVLTAARYWRDACRRFGRTRETDRFAGRLATAFRRALEHWHAEGRIERLLAAREGLAALVPQEPTLAECERLVELCNQAMSQLATADYTALRQTMLRIKAAGGDVAWVHAALDALARVAEGQELLMASPLGLFASTTDTVVLRDQPPAVAQDTPKSKPSAAAEPADPRAVRLGPPLLVLVDGGGSNLLVCQDRARIGRADTSAEIDIPVPGNLESHHADITRRGEDYFLTAYGPVEVNRRRVEHTLLRDGDRIVLGSKAKMVFAKPSSKSESAVLKLSHRCRLPQDVSNVVLFRQTCLLGTGASCHLRTQEGGGQVVLFERGGTLHARPTAGRGWAQAEAQPVMTGVPLELGEVRITVKAYEVPR